MKEFFEKIFAWLTQPAVLSIIILVVIAALFVAYILVIIALYKNKRLRRDYETYVCDTTIRENSAKIDEIRDCKSDSCECNDTVEITPVPAEEVTKEEPVEEKVDVLEPPVTPEVINEEPENKIYADDREKEVSAEADEVVHIGESGDPVYDEAVTDVFVSHAMGEEVTTENEEYPSESPAEDAVIPESDPEPEETDKSKDGLREITSEEVQAIVDSWVEEDKQPETENAEYTVEGEKPEKKEKSTRKHDKSGMMRFTFMQLKNIVMLLGGVGHWKNKTEIVRAIKLIIAMQSCTIAQITNVLRLNILDVAEEEIKAAKNKADLIALLKSALGGER